MTFAAALAIAQNLPAGTQKIENTALAVTRMRPMAPTPSVPGRNARQSGAPASEPKLTGIGSIRPATRSTISRSHPSTDELGEGSQLTVTNAGLPDEPDLVCVLRLYTDPSFAEIEVQLQNGTQKQITAQAIRVLEAAGEPRVNLAAPDSADRVLSDSFSEDRPAMAIHDLLAAEDGMHRGVGSQLIYNRQSKQSLFVGALSSERWLTVLRLHVDAQSRKISGYEVDSTGTTELAKENSLRESPPQDQMELSLPVAPGASLSAEPVMLALGADYHAQLELYGNLIRKLHHPRVTAATPMGWWSWTAFYFGLTEGTALTNAEFLAQELKPFGYTFFHIDEGYQYARGEYTTPDATKFPHGVRRARKPCAGLGLTPGIWTAPVRGLTAVLALPASSGLADSQCAGPADSRRVCD